MELTENQEKLLNKACENLRKEGKDIHNADEKRKRAKKEIEMALKENSNLTKIRRQETVDSDECATEVQKSDPN